MSLFCTPSPNGLIIVVICLCRCIGLERYGHGGFGDSFVTGEWRVRLKNGLSIYPAMSCQDGYYEKHESKNALGNRVRVYLKKGNVEKKNEEVKRISLSPSPHISM